MTDHDVDEEVKAVGDDGNGGTVRNDDIPVTIEPDLSILGDFDKPSSSPRSASGNSKKVAADSPPLIQMIEEA